MTGLLHVGQELRSLTDPTWPTIVITAIYENPTRDGFAGHTLRPFAAVTWADGEKSHLGLEHLRRAWEDTGV
jgi:hypothetical protein